MMKIEWRSREPIEDNFQARLAQEVEAIDHEVYRLHAQQIERASDAASWATNSRLDGSPRSPA